MVWLLFASLGCVIEKLFSIRGNVECFRLIAILLFCSFTWSVLIREDAAYVPVLLLFSNSLECYFLNNKYLNVPVILCMYFIIVTR